jgi:hypothetical protein
MIIGNCIAAPGHVCYRSLVLSILTHHDYGKSINGYHSLGVKPALNSQQAVKKTWWVYPAAFSVVKQSSYQ